MALPDTVRWQTPTARTTGISSASIAAGANVLGTAIDNRTNLDTLADVEIVMDFSGTPSANEVVYVYVLRSLDGVAFEDGDATKDPIRRPEFVMVVSATTGVQRKIETVQLPPQQFKLLVRNETSSAASVTVNLMSYSHEVVD